MIKLIASDMDGTLINSKHEISRENLEAIKKAQEMGVEFAIATGRDYSMVKPFLDKYNLKCEAILMNGAEYRDEDGNVIENIVISNEKAKKIISILTEKVEVVEFYTSDGMYTLSYSKKYEEEMVERFTSFNKDMGYDEALKVVREHKKEIKEISIEDAYKILDTDLKVYKILTFNKDTNVIANLKETLKEVENIAVAATSDNDIEINDIKAQKGYILENVARKKKIPKDEVMILGDSFNDYTMFTQFKKSYAMGNALDGIKKIASFITDTNANNGVAKAIIKELGLN